MENIFVHTEHTLAWLKKAVEIADRRVIFEEIRLSESDKNVPKDKYKGAKQ